MRKVLLLVLPLVGALVLPRAAQAEDTTDPRALIARAIAAQGGEERAAPDMAVLVKIKGAIADPSVPFTGTLYSHGEQQARFTLKVSLGNEITLTEAYEDGKGWAETDGQVRDMSDAERASMEKSLYVDRLTSLVPLLKDKSYTLKALDESKIEDRPALGVKVSSTGHPDVSLYFDKDSSLLVKYAYLDRDPTTNKDALHEIYYSDFREADLSAGDEQALKGAGLAVTGPALLEFLKQQTPGVDRDRIKALIRQLGDDSFDVRQKASADLIALGSAAVPLLREATTNADLEVSRRAQECLKKVGDHTSTGLVAAALRLVAHRRPAGAAEALLAFLSQTTDPELVREGTVALAAVALRDSKPDPVVLAALEDKDAHRRAAATAALGRDGGAFAKQPGRRVYLEGLKMPMKAVTYAGGKKLLEREILEVQLFNRFPDDVFARPRQK